MTASQDQETSEAIVAVWKTEAAIVIGACMRLGAKPALDLSGFAAAPSFA